jgi:hypothetical protein
MHGAKGVVVVQKVFGEFWFAVGIFVVPEVFPQKPPKTPTQPDKSAPDKKWTRFTYFRKEARFITKLFKNTSVKVTYTTRNTINRLLSAQYHTQKDKYENQASTDWHASIAKRRMLDRQVDQLGSTNTSGTTNMPTANQNSPNTFWTTTTPLAPCILQWTSCTSLQREQWWTH